MTGREVLATAQALVADKGLLAIDESNPACSKRFAGTRISRTGETRRAYRALIVTTADNSSRFSASGNGRIFRLSFASGSGPGVGPGLHSFAPLPAQSPYRSLLTRQLPPRGAKGGPASAPDLYFP
jgi:hypothetical protein